MDDDGIDILDDRTLEVVDHCDGPVAGICSRVRANGVVACAGRRIRPGDAAPEYMLLQVPAGSQHCPLAWNLEAMGM
jgi:hypothetical protein